jgi:dipeptidyl-peptidase-4
MLFPTPRPVRSWFILLLLWLPLAPAFSQSKQLTVEDAFLNRDLQPQNLKQLSWIPGSKDELSYVFPAFKTKRSAGTEDKPTDHYPESLKSLSTTVSGKEPKLLATPVSLTEALRAAGATEEFKTFPMMQWRDANTLLVTSKNQVYAYDVKASKASRQFGYDAAAENAELDPTKTRIAYTKEQNLFISAAGRENEAVTNETNAAIVNGQAAHRSEFGITKGTFWSSSGSKLAFSRMDQTMVSDYPLVDVSTTPASLKNIKYPMAGDKSHQVSVGVYDLNTRKTVFLQTGEPREQYLTNLAWSPDEKAIYLAVLNREQNAMKLNQYDAATGAFVKTLFEETDAKYVEPQHALKFVPGHTDQFVWQSQRDGYNHLYLYNTSGKLLRQLTKGNWLVTEVLDFANKGRDIVYIGTADSPLERHVYTVSLSGGEPRKVSQGTGTHAATLSPSGAFILDNFSSSVTPRTIRTVGVADGKSKRLLLNAANPLTGYQLGETKLFPIKSADGSTDLYCRLITPPNFDASKKYPTVVYLYGGPHVQLVTESWLGGSNLWMQQMAQKGYVVFTIDSRGSGNRGRAFEQATFRQLGTAEMADQLEGVKYLKTLPYVDQARMGIHGWSFGGFMTTTLMTRAPGTFKVGIAGGPVIDWRKYEVMYTERYMDTPQENPEGYKQASLLNYVPKLQGKLLLIHGTVDDVVVWQHSLDYLKKAVDEGVLLDYFVYPGHPHNVMGKDRVHLYKKVTQYFDDNL